MDQFAQSRGDDDLFDDEIVPIQKSPQSLPAADSSSDQVATQTVPDTTYTTPEVRDTSNSTNRGRVRGRGRGRGGVNPQQHAAKPGLSESRFAPKQGPAQTNSPKREPAKEDSDVKPDPTEERSIADPATADESAPSTSIPTGPSTPTLPRLPAVKGDRLNTGGIQRPKLTEDELNAKLAAAKERNQNRAAAYAREQADAENFAQRERIASVKRAKENADRKALEGEREKNRERKLRGQGGREWDAKKNESDYAGRNRGDRRRNFAPEHDNDNDLSMYEWNEDRGRGRGRGRGGRGARGRGRGDTGSFRGTNRPSQPDINAETDFPALPGSTTKKPIKEPSVASKSLDNLDAGPGGSWAEQVEAGETAGS